MSHEHNEWHFPEEAVSIRNPVIERFELLERVSSNSGLVGLTSLSASSMQGPNLPEFNFERHQPQMEAMSLNSIQMQRNRLSNNMTSCRTKFEALETRLRLVAIASSASLQQADIPNVDQSQLDQVLAQLDCLQSEVEKEREEMTRLAATVLEKHAQLLEANSALTALIRDHSEEIKVSTVPCSDRLLFMFYLQDRRPDISKFVCKVS